jgi:hypothetical protein
MSFSHLYYFKINILHASILHNAGLQNKIYADQVAKYENLNKISSKWPPRETYHVPFIKHYIFCFTTGYKIMISNHFQITGDYIQKHQ